MPTKIRKSTLSSPVGPDRPMNPPTRSEISGLAVPSMVSGLNLAGVPIAACRASATREADGLHAAVPKKKPIESGPCLSMMSLQAGAEVIQAARPMRRPGVAVNPHPGAFEPVGVMVHLRQRPAFRAGVPLRQRVLQSRTLTTLSPSTSTRIPQTDVQTRRGRDVAGAGNRTLASREHPTTLVAVEFFIYYAGVPRPERHPVDKLLECSRNLVLSDGARARRGRSDCRG